MIKKNNGRNNSKIPYNVNDNDLYWLNMPDKNTFFVIPPDVLFEKEYLSSDDKKGRGSICLYYEFPQNASTKWADKYKFKYNNINDERNRLLELFKLTNC